MPYSEFAPCPELAPIVRCFWVFESEGWDPEPPVQRILPDGCPEIVLHYRAPMQEAAPGAAPRRQPERLLAGQLSGPLWLRPGPETGLVAARLQPWGGRLLARLPMMELTNARLSLDAVFGSMAADLHQRVAEPQAPERRVRLLEAALLNRARASRASLDPMVRGWVEALAALPAQATLQSLAAATSHGPRQIQRLFLREVGLSPRMLTGIFRFQRFLGLLRDRPRAPQIQVALDAGYFDQAHLIHQFRALADCTPREHLRQIPGLSLSLTGSG